MSTRPQQKPLPGQVRTPVTVIGLGAMGSALAAAFMAAGHPTTVWNRTAARAVPLVAGGAAHPATVAEAVAASPPVVTCPTTFEDTVEALGPAAGALRGRDLVTLNSGSPEGVCRALEEADERKQQRAAHRHFVEGGEVRGGAPRGVLIPPTAPSGTSARRASSPARPRSDTPP